MTQQEFQPFRSTSEMTQPEFQAFMELVNEQKPQRPQPALQSVVAALDAQFNELDAQRVRKLNAKKTSKSDHHLDEESNSPPLKRQKVNKKKVANKAVPEQAGPSQVHDTEASSSEATDVELSEALEVLEKALPPQSMTDIPRSASAPLPSQSQGKCIWCLVVKSLLPNKKFCEKCNSQGRECAYCHRPMPDRFFTLSPRLCNACFKKHENLKAKRRRLTVERRAMKKHSCSTLCLQHGSLEET